MKTQQPKSTKSQTEQTRRTCQECQQVITDHRRKLYCSGVCAATAIQRRKGTKLLRRRWRGYPAHLQAKLEEVLATYGYIAAVAATETLQSQYQGVGKDEAPFRVLLFGIDNVYLSFAPQVSDEIYYQLLQEQQRAKDARKERNADYCSEWLDAKVYPGGANGFAILINKADEWLIKLQQGNEQRPGVYIEMRSKVLHTHPGGPWAACEEAVTWIRETFFADASKKIRDQIVLGEEKLSRYDIHLDWQGGWHPTLEEGEHRMFIKPARAGWEPHMSGETCTGYSIGKRRVMARIYNKTTEAAHREDDEYLALIREQAGEKYDATLDIWRVEFELKREGVEGFCLDGQQEDELERSQVEQIAAEMDAEDLPTIGTLKKAMRWTPHLWRYLTTRWLRVVEPNGDKNRARWPVHPVWQQIQEGFIQPTSDPLPPDKCKLVREQRHSGRRRLINRLATAITHSAYLMLYSDPTLAVRDFTEQIEHFAKQLADYQQEKRAHRRQRMKDTLQEQFHRNVQHLAHIAGGTFAIAGVLKQDLPVIGEMPDLMLHIAPDLEEIAKYKGGVPQMLYDKWCREYKVMPPSKLLRFTTQAA